jgi:hypothetical protein
MNKQEFLNKMNNRSIDSPMNEFEEKIYTFRDSYVPPAGDYLFCITEDLDKIISDKNEIIVKYPKCDLFVYKAQFYRVKSKNRYITWRDILETLEKEKGKLEKYNNHRFIEDIVKTSPVQYELFCGS